MTETLPGEDPAKRVALALAAGAASVGTLELLEHPAMLTATAKNTKSERNGRYRRIAESS
ncbi:MAG TPA: hypothetical protein VN603_02855 [Candidatus Acidoferrales bacterium]|nr:hypothetical protein [Candidatus Acidoferrales bacterium]